MEETKIEEVTEDVKVEVTDEEQEAFKDTEENTIDISDDTEEVNND